MRGLKTKYRNHPFFKDFTNTIVSIYKDHSQQIVNMYIELKTQEEIADELMLTKKYNISLGTAKSYINKILSSILDKRQMNRLKKKHLSQAVRKRNAIYGPPKLTPALREASKQRMVKMSSEDKRALSHLAIRAKGHVPWEENETNQFLKMCGQKKYQHINRNGTKRPDHKLIAEVLNNRFHQGKEIRTPRSLTVKKDNLKKIRVL